MVLEAATIGKNKDKIRAMLPEAADEELTNEVMMVAGLMQSATNGNVKAYEVLTAQADKAEATTRREEDGYTIPITDITTDFVEAYREIHEAYRTGKWRTVVLRGGRGSIKSNFAAAIAEETIYQDKMAHVVFTRRYKTNLRDTVYSQFQKTVIRHGKQDLWTFTASPMCATLNSTGQKVVFLGCDKPISAKSFTVPFGYVKLLINEEADEMAGMEQMDSIEDTMLRNDTFAVNLKVYNPPPSIHNFMNAFCLEPPDKTLICESNYQNVPREWLGQRFFERADWFREHRPRYYDNYYGGQVTGTGGAVFENVVGREITDAEVSTLEHLHYGIDFGFAVDPFAYVKLAFDRKHMRIFVLDELYETNLSNRDATSELQKRTEGENAHFWADSAEPKSIKEMQSYGLKVAGAKKGKDSVRHSMRWLQDLCEIVIDPSKTPNAYREFSGYEYKSDGNGGFISSYPDADNHLIDACRYCLMLEMRDERTGLFA